MGLSLDARELMLDGFSSYLDSGGGPPNLTLYQGITSLAVFPLTAEFLAANLDTLVIDGMPISSTGTEVAGTANRFIVNDGGGETAFEGTVGAIGSGAHLELSSLTVTAALTQTLNSLVFRMSATGDFSVEASFTLQ